MPSERFIHLPDEKKERIKNAAISELSQVSLDELSINRIIKVAEIPRGSFYEYFEDKYDLVNYIMSDFKVAIKEFTENEISENNRDIFKIAENLFSFIIDLKLENNNMQLFKNIFSCLKFSEKDLKFMFYTRNMIIDKYYDKVDLDNYKISSKEEFACLLDVILDIFAKETVSFFIEPKNQVQHKELFLKKLSILKYGVIKPL
ncbi:MAG: TetR family transcriptional regulator [Acutalibacteraceae bacterium]|nr:TetR family transcriptional regulator [Acutalibacteraceae bacterium]